MLDMDGLDGQPVTAEELPLLGVSPSSPLNSNPETVTFALESGESIEIFAVTYIDDKLLVAVPISVWNKRVAQRLLPKDFLQKPVVVEVLACKPEDPSSDLEEFKGRVWMGFIAPSYLAKLEVVTEDVNFDYPFKLGDSEELWPSPRGLVEAAVEHFAFQSAEDLPHAGASGSAVDARLDRLESSVDRMAEMMTQLVSAQQPPVVGRKSVQKSVLQPDPLTADPGTSKFPLLDSSVVHAALAAGVNEDALLEMQKLIGKGQPKVKKLGEPLMTLKPKAKAGKVRNVLSESEDEDGVNAGGSGGVALAHPATGSDSMLGELTKIVKLLTDDKMRKARVSKVEAALEGISSSGVTDGSLGTGKKAAAARRALRSALQESPEEIYGLLEKLMLEDLSHQTVTPGQPGPVLCARAWLEHRSRVGAYKTSAYYCLVSSRDSRFTYLWKRGCCTSPCRFVAPDARSGGCRSRQLGVGQRTEFRTRSTIRCIIPSPTSFCGGRRSSFFKTLRPSLGGGCPLPSEGHRRVCESQREVGPQRQRRIWRSKPEAKTESQVERVESVPRASRVISSESDALISSTMVSDGSL